MASLSRCLTTKKTSGLFRDVTSPHRNALCFEPANPSVSKVNFDGGAELAGSLDTYAHRNPSGVLHSLFIYKPIKRLAHPCIQTSAHSPTSVGCSYLPFLVLASSPLGPTPALKKVVFLEIAASVRSPALYIWNISLFTPWYV